MRLHHLNDSRSQKVVWMLEELGCPYEMVRHQRHPETMMGPPELKAAHPIGKAPILEAEGRAIVESGAIFDYILRRHGEGRLMPDPTGPLLLPYLEWMYFAVSIGATPIMLKVYARWTGEQAKALDEAADREFALALGYLEAALDGHEWLVGDGFTAADIQVSFVAELARSLGALASYPNIDRWLARLHARPGFRASIAKGGDYIFAR